MKSKFTKKTVEQANLLCLFHGFLISFCRAAAHCLFMTNYEVCYFDLEIFCSSLLK